MWSKRRIAAVTTAAAVLMVTAVVVWPKSTTVEAATADLSITAPGGVGEDATISLDATIYLPKVTPAPAVILAHGLGGTKESVVADAQDLATSGYVVLAYTARGFGGSTGHVHLDSLDYEVPDARAVVDYLATRPEVSQDAAGDPRVGVMGGSYGGALSLMLAGTDKRVDAAVPMITWNSLGDALFPNYVAAGAAPLDGVFKQYWTSILMTSVTAAGRTGGGASGLAGVLAGATGTSGATGGLGTTSSGGGSGSGATGTDGAPATASSAFCGRLALDLCTGYLDVAQTGRLTESMSALLDNASPAKVVGQITAPTLLVQGEKDTLFGLDQSDRNAKAIAANGTPVSVIWFAGGHDGGSIDTNTRAAIHSWLDHYLAKTAPAPELGFRYSIDGAISDTGAVRSRTLQAPAYLGVTTAGGIAVQSLTLSGTPTPVVNPPGGSPAGLSSLPGLGGTASTALASLGLDIPGQSATFTSAPLTSQILLTGSAGTTLSVTGGPPAPGGAANTAASVTEATLFVKLYKMTASGVRTLAGSAASPIRVTGLAPGTTVQVPVQLTPVALQIDVGSSVQLVVSTTDQAFAVPSQAAGYVIGLDGDGTMTLPVAGGSNISTSEIPVGLLIALIVLLVVVVIALILGGLVRPHRSDIDPALTDIPLRITGLRKQYPGGVTAVADVSFDVLAGQVVGLLGPNGAGKTTALRMVMGLISPSAGQIRVFGHKITAGAPVLSRIGSFVEGSGFLPHLSGQDNLRLYWQATGRPPELAFMEQALEIAGLGSAIKRRVRTYSQGMRQRLAIAQAMLGLPDLLILDEPTNGLDPPQIHAMREVLRRYAATGRTVLVSSHLLAEVEQTCSHVVVINQGRVIAAGTVDELVSASGEMSFTVDDPTAAARVLGGLSGVNDIEILGNQVHADLAETPPAEAIAALVRAGVFLTQAAPRNRLEDVFLDLVGASGGGSPGGPS